MRIEPLEAKSLKEKVPLDIRTIDRMTVSIMTADIITADQMNVGIKTVGKMTRQNNC